MGNFAVGSALFFVSALGNVAAGSAFFFVSLSGFGSNFAAALSGCPTGVSEALGAAAGFFEMLG